MLSSNHVIDAASVSRNHFEVYSISFDQTAETLVFVRDRQSLKGTFVNDTLLGNKTTISNGKLLDNGDKITIKPGITIKVILLDMDRIPLTEVQQREAALFDDEYKVTDRLLGEGSYASTRLAIDARTGTQVACKIYDIEKLHRQNKNTSKDVLIKPIQIMTQLEHSNIAAFKRAYTTPHNIYVFEELASGGDLFTLQYRNETFEEDAVRWVVYQILQAVKYLHQKGVVHRDIKPENVLCMTCPHPNHRIALTDFGHAGLLRDGKLSANLGTPGYQAPETFGEDAEYDQKADMWSVGITTATLLGTSGLLDSLDRIGRSMNNSEPMKTVNLQPVFEELKVLRPEPLSKQGRDFLRKCLTVDPNKRISAREALGHPWLDEAGEIRDSFAANARRIRSTWVGRQVLLEMVSELPDIRRPKRLRLTMKRTVPAPEPRKKTTKRKRTEEEEEKKKTKKKKNDAKRIKK